MKILRVHKSLMLTALLTGAMSFLPFLAQATTVFIQEVKIENGDPALRTTLRELLRGAVNNEGGFEAASSAEAAELQLQPKLMKLGDAYLLTIDKLKGSQVLYTATLKAATAEDLDVVSTRVVRSALRGVKASDTALVTDVTEDEKTAGTRRYQATRQWKFGLGPGWGTETNTNSSGTHWMLGYVWGLDPLWDVDLTYRYTSLTKSGETGGSFGDFSLGASYNLNLERHAPYVTFGFGRASSEISSTQKGLFGQSEDTASGWSAHVGGGYRFFRTSNVNLAVEGTYTQMFDKSSISGKTPGVFNLAAVIYY